MASRNAQQATGSRSISTSFGLVVLAALAVLVVLRLAFASIRVEAGVK